MAMLSLKQFVPVGVNPRLGVQFCGSLQVAGIDIAQCDYFYIFMCGYLV
jgi:hypothetical protein